MGSHGAIVAKNGRVALGRVAPYSFWHEMVRRWPPLGFEGGGLLVRGPWYRKGEYRIENESCSYSGHQVLKRVKSEPSSYSGHQVLLGNLDLSPSPELVHEFHPLFHQLLLGTHNINLKRMII